MEVMYGNGPRLDSRPGGNKSCMRQVINPGVSKVSKLDFCLSPRLACIALKS